MKRLWLSGLVACSLFSTAALVAGCSSDDEDLGLGGGSSTTTTSGPGTGGGTTGGGGPGGGGNTGGGGGGNATVDDPDMDGPYDTAEVTDSFMSSTGNTVP
ncbi:MAG TPA: hypothetical protein VLS89_00890, partial [Candidatus Nanopelagicales bacterium]|nr:hypothetical protein [Candidatus Nanopelagicales bacterium]